MSKQATDETSNLAASALALEEEIARFERLAADAQRTPLDSQKHIEQAAKAARDAAESEERFTEKVRALVEAVAQARDRQARAAEAINARIADVNSRAEIFAGLQRDFVNLGEEAKGINDQVKGAASGETVDGEAAKLAAIREVGDRLGKAADNAAALAEKAREAGFVDLTHHADGLRQQLLAARNKLKLVQQALEPL